MKTQDNRHFYAVMWKAFDWREGKTCFRILSNQVYFEKYDTDINIYTTNVSANEWTWMSHDGHEHHHTKSPFKAKAFPGLELKLVDSEHGPGPMLRNRYKIAILFIAYHYER